MTNDNWHNRLEILVCPKTQQNLQYLPLAEAEQRMDTKLVSIRIPTQYNDDFTEPVPIGTTAYVLVREDMRFAYPIVDDIPILLIPEMLGAMKHQREFDLQNSIYAEAYEEMEVYNKFALSQAENIESSNSYPIIQPLSDINESDKEAFPNPVNLWIDAVHDCAGQSDAYAHIKPIAEKRILQIGGKGTHIIKFLLGGAKEGWSLSPMLGELQYTIALAKAFGITDSLQCVVAAGEELPFKDSSIDAIYSGGCIHHTVTDRALPEAARILVSGGKFAAVDPWKTPIHGIGTRVLGKREADVYCRPIDEARALPLERAFPESSIIHHGAIFRYPLLALQKLGISTSLTAAWKMNKIDDFLSSLVPLFRNKFGGSVTLLGTK